MKNGFTIVELLSAIAIMALIIVISVPAYEGISKTIKEQNFNSKISMMEQSTQSYISKYHKNKVFNNNEKAILIISIPYLIDKSVFQADDVDNNKMTNPLTGGYLEGYLMATYNSTTYEVEVKYEELTYSDFQTFKNIYNSSLNSINNMESTFALNENQYNIITDNISSENKFIHIYKG